jgi:phosphoenolpyruvate carboxykinase (GTP)
MRWDENGKLRAINPEAGFFGVAPGTNWKTNPVAMETVQKNTIFTNVGMTEDGGVFWEGMEKDTPADTNITTWLGDQWKIGQEGKAAHPNSRFCSPASECPIIHPAWEDPEGVPIDAIVFGGRRPEGVPLVFETFSWEHGVLTGAALKSETTAAAEFKGKKIMHDPMAMRPFMGYNFGDYLQHWLDLKQPTRHMPKIFHVNWFRLNEQGKFLWPGFGENIRVIDWMCRRMEGEDIAEPSPVGYLPKKGSINLSGLKDGVNWDELFSLPKQYWQEDVKETRQFLSDQVGEDLPQAVRDELNNLESRIDSL